MSLENKVLLSSGSIPWYGLDVVSGLERLDHYAITNCRYDGVELLPQRAFVWQVQNAIGKFGEDWPAHLAGTKSINRVHQSWRLDDPLERSHSLKPSFFNRALRLVLFPSLGPSQNFVATVSREMEVPVTVHDITPDWTEIENREFFGGIDLEISGHSTRTLPDVWGWLNKPWHHFVADTRDDQSIAWGKKNRLMNFMALWQYFGLRRIGNIQLSLIGERGMAAILNNQETLAEKELLWLHQQRWNGSVTVEANPLTLLKVGSGKLSRKLIVLRQFVQTTLQDGKSWS